MSQRTNTPWIAAGGLLTRFRVEQDHLVREPHQPGYDDILRQNAIERELPRQRAFGGWKVASIPVNDLRAVYAKYPELKTHAGQCDAQEYTRAVVRFTNDPEFAHCVIKRA